MNNIDNFIAEFPEVINWEIKIGKKRRGRWRTPVRMQLNIDENFCKAYNPVFPKWYSLPFFEGTIFHKKECKQECQECRKNLWEKLGFVLFEEENPTNTKCERPCDIFYRNCTNYIAEFFLEWRPGIPDHSKETEVLKEIMKCLEKEVLNSLAEAYNSTELEEIKITRQTENIKKEETNNNKTKRKINIA